MKELTRFILGSLLILALVIAGGIQLTQSPAQAQEFDRRAMLEGLVTETILPLHEILLEKATALEAAALAFQADPTEETLTDFQAAWQETSIAFEHIQVYGFQRVMPYMTQIDTSPPNIPFIEGYIEIEPVGTLDAAFVQNIGSSSKGLPTLEYFIFVEDALTQLTESQNRMDYAVGAATDVKRVAEELVMQWTPEAGGFADRFIAADGEVSSVRSAVSMLSNEMIAELEDVSRFWIGGPLGFRDGGDPQPDLVEAFYSGTSVDKLIANVEGFQMALNGLGDSPSLADYLDFLGAEYDGVPMSEAINIQAETVITALQAIESPLQVAVIEEPGAVNVAYDEGVALLQLVKTDMASQLGITVTFSDNDGD